MTEKFQFFEFDQCEGSCFLLGMFDHGQKMSIVTMKYHQHLLLPSSKCFTFKWLVYIQPYPSTRPLAESVLVTATNLGHVLEKTFSGPFRYAVATPIIYQRFSTCNTESKLNYDASRILQVSVRRKTKVDSTRHLLAQHSWG